MNYIGIWGYIFVITRKNDNVIRCLWMPLVPITNILTPCRDFYSAVRSGRGQTSHGIFTILGYTYT